MLLKKKTLSAAISAVLALAASALLLQGCVGATPVVPSQTVRPAASPEGDDFSDREREALLESLKNAADELELMDYVIGTRSSLIYAAAVCKKLDTGAETVLTYVTEAGAGYVDLAAGVMKLKYCAEDGIWLKLPDTVSLSLRDTDTEQISDYEIAFAKQDAQTLAITVDSTVRQ